MKREYRLYDNSDINFNVKSPESATLLYKTKCIMTANTQHIKLGGTLYRYESNNDGTLYRRVLLIDSPRKPSRPERQEGPRRIKSK